MSLMTWRMGSNKKRRGKNPKIQLSPKSLIQLELYIYIFISENSRVVCERERERGGGLSLGYLQNSKHTSQ